MDKLIPDISPEALAAVERELSPDTVYRPEPVVPVAWDATNPKGYTSVVQMSTAEFNAWCDDGRPSLRRAAKVAPASEKRTSGAVSAVSWRELHEVVGIIADETSRVDGQLNKEIIELRKTVGALKQDSEYARDTNLALGREMDAMKATVAQLKRDHEMEKKLAEQRVLRRAENLEIALLAAGRNPDQDTEGEIPQMDWRGQHAHQ